MSYEECRHTEYIQNLFGTNICAKCSSAVVVDHIRSAAGLWSILLNFSQ